MDTKEAMEISYLKIVGFGLIGEDTHGGPYRQVIFKDTKTDKAGELLVFKKERPILWDDIEKLEQGGTIPPYKGFIVCYNTVDVVVLGDEKLEDAFSRQRWKLNLKGKISYAEAEAKRIESQGYRTNLTYGSAMEISWMSIDKNALLIKYRFYNKNGIFIWTNWYEIVVN